MHSPNDHLVVIRSDPLNAETPLAQLAAAETPAENVYVRTNFGVPELDAAHHRIRIDGALHSPCDLGIDALRQFERVHVRTTMECAGNDRISTRPLPDGEPWGGGALSTATWTGVRLADVLARANPNPGVVEYVVEGADRGTRADASGVVQFARALPVDAVSRDVLLAIEMNGAPLTSTHGAPVRLIVPGWYGMASVKWVTRISAVTQRFDGYFQRQRYVYDTASGIVPVTQMRVKSIIVAPADAARVSPGVVRAWGWAWSGAGVITRVDVSRNSDDAWHSATLDLSAGAHAWTRWHCPLTLDRHGRYVIRARATDSTGAVQPLVPEWNRLGYGNNAVQSAVVACG